MLETLVKVTPIVVSVAVMAPPADAFAKQRGVLVRVNGQVIAQEVTLPVPTVILPRLMAPVMAGAVPQIPSVGAVPERWSKPA